MEGRFTHQRRTSKIKEQLQSEASQPDQEQHENTHVELSPTKSKRRWSYGIVIYPLAVCFLIVLAFLRQSSAPDPLQSLLSPPRHRLEEDHSVSHNPDAARPRIELYPDDHIYREPVTQHLDWVITSDNLRPDGVLKRVYLINDLFPGPTIEARSGDTLVITVTNSLEEETFSIHWHGLHVQNSMDGAGGVTQCPIAPGSKFVYNFTIPQDQSGTFWYHAHSGVARADGLYGGFVVHAPAPKSTVRGLMGRENSLDQHRHSSDKEVLLLIGDWYHRQAGQILTWYMRAGSFGNEPVPDSLLINGVGHFECSMAVPARPLDCVENHANLSYLDIDGHSAYRLRVVNTGSLAGFTLGFDHALLDVIQIDSVDIEPQEAANSAGILFPGQRMDAILRSSPDRSDRQSSITIQLDEECFKYANPALTPQQTFSINTTTSTIESPTTEQITNTNNSITINLEKVPSTSTILAALPPKAQQTHVVYTKIEKLSRNHNVPYGFFNRTSWKPQNNPAIPLLSLPQDQWDKNQLSISTGPEPVWVDLIVNNLDEGSHPFHLHGHHFYILDVYQAAIGWGSYNPFIDPYPPSLSESDSYDLSRAMLRDTVQIPSRGYAVIRFRADNPGVWMFHCHILWHLANGMAMVVDVMGDGREVSSGAEMCGDFRL